jgi:hypothetical protein
VNSANPVRRGERRGGWRKTSIATGRSGNASRDLIEEAHAVTAGIRARETGRPATCDLANGRSVVNSETRRRAGKETGLINEEGRVSRIGIIAERIVGEGRREAATAKSPARRASSRGAETRVSAAAGRRNGRFESGRKLLKSVVASSTFVDLDQLWGELSAGGEFQITRIMRSQPMCVIAR